MDLVEVLERRRQLRQNGPGIAEVHATDVVALERVDEALGHAVALRAAHRRVDRREAERLGDASSFAGDVGAAVIGQELQQVVRRHGLHGPEALLDGLDEHLAHRLARQPFALPGPEGHDLAITAVLGKRGGHGLARVALDLEAVRAPA